MQEGEAARLQRVLSALDSTSCGTTLQQQAAQPAPRRSTPGTPAQRPRVAPPAAKRGASAAASFCLLPGLLPVTGAAHPRTSRSIGGTDCSRSA